MPNRQRDEYSIREIVALLHVSFYRVLTALEKTKIQPVRWLGRTRLYSAQQVKTLRDMILATSPPPRELPPRFIVDDNSKRTRLMPDTKEPSKREALRELLTKGE